MILNPKSDTKSIDSESPCMLVYWDQSNDNKDKLSFNIIGRYALHQNSSSVPKTVFSMAFVNDLYTPTIEDVHSCTYFGGKVEFMSTHLNPIGSEKLKNPNDLRSTI